MVLDVSNAFIQNSIPPNKYSEERLIIKITGVLVDMILKLDSATYSKHVVFEIGKKVIYVFLLRAIYVTLLELLLFYKKFCGDLEKIDF